MLLQLQQREHLVHAGRHGELLGEDLVDAPVGEQVDIQRWTACQLRSSSASAWTSCAQRLSATGTGWGPSSASSESDRLCAGSVEHDGAQPAAGDGEGRRCRDVGFSDFLARIEDRAVSPPRFYAGAGYLERLEGNTRTSPVTLLVLPARSRAESLKSYVRSASQRAGPSGSSDRARTSRLCRGRCARTRSARRCSRARSSKA